MYQKFEDFLNVSAIGDYSRNRNRGLLLRIGG